MVLGILGPAANRFWMDEVAAYHVDIDSADRKLGGHFHPPRFQYVGTCTRFADIFQ